VTKDKVLKRAVRARMAKTGEHYTTARYYLLDLHRQPEAASNDAGPDGAVSAIEPEASAPGAAAILTEPSSLEEAANGSATLPPRVIEPGMTDAAIKRGTGKTWDEWFALLDAWGAASRNHTEIARHVYETHGVDGWWAQGVTVGYERARGMRGMHERPDGFSMNASKTFPVPLERLFAALVEEDERTHWLDGIELRLRTSQPHRSARFDVLPADKRLAVNFLARGDTKAALQFQMERLPQAEDVTTWKAIWKTQFDHLAAYLAPQPTTASGTGQRSASE
jgi:hypothetical protein